MFLFSLCLFFVFHFSSYKFRFFNVFNFHFQSDNWALNHKFLCEGEGRDWGLGKDQVGSLGGPGCIFFLFLKYELLVGWGRKSKFIKKQIWNVSNNSQIDTFYIYKYHICLTSEKLKYRNQTKIVEFLEWKRILYSSISWDLIMYLLIYSLYVWISYLLNLLCEIVYHIFLY